MRPPSWRPSWRPCPTTPPRPARCRLSRRPPGGGELGAAEVAACSSFGPSASPTASHLLLQFSAGCAPWRWSACASCCCGRGWPSPRTAPRCARCWLHSTRRGLRRCPRVGPCEPSWPAAWLLSRSERLLHLSCFNTSAPPRCPPQLPPPPLRRGRRAGRQPHDRHQALLGVLRRAGRGLAGWWGRLLVLSSGPCAQPLAHQCPVPPGLPGALQIPDQKPEDAEEAEPSSLPHQHACLLVLDALRGLADAVDCGAAPEKVLKTKAKMRCGGGAAAHPAAGHSSRTGELAALAANSLATPVCPPSCACSERISKAAGAVLQQRMVDEKGEASWAGCFSGWIDLCLKGRSLQRTHHKPPARLPPPPPPAGAGRQGVEGAGRAAGRCAAPAPVPPQRPRAGHPRAGAPRVCRGARGGCGSRWCCHAGPCSRQQPAPATSHRVWRGLPLTCLQVPESLSRDAADKCVDGYPSLSGSTLSTWYRVCFEQLQARGGSAAACLLACRCLRQPAQWWWLQRWDEAAQGADAACPRPSPAPPSCRPPGRRRCGRLRRRRRTAACWRMRPPWPPLWPSSRWVLQALGGNSSLGWTIASPSCRVPPQCRPAPPPSRPCSTWSSCRPSACR